MGLVDAVLALGCLLKRRPDITIYNNVLLYILWGQSTWCTHIIFNIICVSNEAPSSKGGPFLTNIIIYMMFVL